MQAIWQVPLWAAAILGTVGGAVLLSGIGALLCPTGRRVRRKPRRR